MCVCVCVCVRVFVCVCVCVCAYYPNGYVCSGVAQVLGFIIVVNVRVIECTWHHCAFLVH